MDLRRGFAFWGLTLGALACGACGSGASDTTQSTGGHPGTGGAVLGGTGGAGVASSGGTNGSGGATGSGGRPASGGASGRDGVGGPAGGNGLGTGGIAGRPGASGTGGVASTGGPSYPYVFSVFNDSAPNTSLLIYTSTDALNFTLLSDTRFAGPTGTLRDPSIMKHTDGKFYVAFTTPPNAGCCGPESSFAIASSADLKTWTTITTVPSGVPRTVNTWAPEWFKDKDGSLYILASIDATTYRYQAMNAALTTFSGPTAIGIGPGFIDTFIVTIGDTYHAFTKRNATLFIEHATSTSLDGPWTFVGTGNWAGWGTHREAPALIDLGNGTWRFYCDGGSAGHELYSDSSDMFRTWTPARGLPNVGNVISHGTVIRGN